MSGFRGLRARLVGAFFLLALGMGLAMAATGWLAFGDLGRAFVLRQTEPVMETLIEAERQSLAAKDEDLEAPDSARLAAVLGWTFLVGKQIGADMAALGPGLHLSGGQFILLRREEGTLYALSGSLAGFASLRVRLLRALALCAGCGLLAAAIIGFSLSRGLSRPLMALAEEARKRSAPGSLAALRQDFPARLAGRRDEVGALARAFAANQKKLHAALLREACFTGDAGHELRTPLAVLAGSLEVLQGKVAGLPPPQAAALAPPLERLARTSDKMRDIVRALLALARDKKAGREERAALPDLLAAALAALSADELAARQTRRSKILAWRAAGKTLRLYVFSSAEVCGDPALMHIVLANLLENALRCGEDIRLFLDAKSLRLANRGSLPAGDIFARGVSGRESGYGFGLSLAARACERLGWRLAATQKNGKIVFRLDFSAGEGD